MRFQFFQELLELIIAKTVEYKGKNDEVIGYCILFESIVRERN